MHPSAVGPTWAVRLLGATADRLGTCSRQAEEAASRTASRAALAGAAAVGRPPSHSDAVRDRRALGGTGLAGRPVGRTTDAEAFNRGECFLS